MMVVRNVNLDMNRGEQLFILGRSGSGKTTFSRCLLGLQPIAEGSVRYFASDGDEIVMRKGSLPVGMVSAVFQNVALFPHLKVRETISLALRRAKRMPANQAREVAQGWLDRFNIGNLAVSGRRKCREARPSVLLLRARWRLIPVLSSSTNRQAHLIRIRFTSCPSLAHDPRRGVAALIVTHDIHFVLQNASRVMVLEQGNARIFDDLAELATSGPPFVMRFLDGIQRPLRNAVPPTSLAVAE